MIKCQSIIPIALAIVKININDTIIKLPIISVLLNCVLKKMKSQINAVTIIMYEIDEILAAFSN